MGICLTSRKSSYSFEMGYCGFKKSGGNSRLLVAEMKARL